MHLPRPEAAISCAEMQRGENSPVQNRDPDLRHAVLTFVSPAHRSFLGHAVADDRFAADSAKMLRIGRSLRCRAFSAFIRSTALLPLP